MSEPDPPPIPVLDLFIENNSKIDGAKLLETLVDKLGV